MALCPNCKGPINRFSIVKEQIDDGQTATDEVLALVQMTVHTTLYSCPNCHIVLGIAQFPSYH